MNARACPAIIEGIPTGSSCGSCGHPVGSHLYPSAVCVECAVLSRLDRIEERLRRLEAR